MPRARVAVISDNTNMLRLLPLQGVYRKVALSKARKCGQIMSIKAIRFSNKNLMRHVANDSMGIRMHFGISYHTKSVRDCTPALAKSACSVHTFINISYDVTKQIYFDTPI